jgi:hypothetical protein
VSKGVSPSQLAEKSIDYTSVRALLRRERKESLAYLKGALAAATGS